MSDWLLFLGAGASRPAPAGLPTFDELAAVILETLGWVPEVREGETGEKVTVWVRGGKAGRAGRFPSIRPPWVRLPPEVVFGTLHRFEVPFGPGLVRLMAGRSPNAVHVVAANALAAGAAVWTTNVDRLVEDAFGALPGGAGDPPRYFRQRSEAAGEPTGQGDLAGGCLVKFHGTIDVADSLAFADRELLTPLPDAVVERLEAIAAGRRMMVYGYAGADLDLRDGFRRAMAAAAEVTWFEPRGEETGRGDIRAAFAEVTINFVPPTPAHDVETARRETGAAFLAAAEAAGLAAPALTDRLAAMLVGDVGDWVRPRTVFAFDKSPPAIVHARLVERFGVNADEGRALRMARLEDLRHVRVWAARAHFRWFVSRSLYHDGVVAKAVRGYLRHPGLTAVPATGRVRDFAFDRGTALLLRDGDWRALDQVTELALRVRRTADGRRRPNDLYYRAHTLRYQFRPTEARAAAREAETGLEGLTGDRVDAERLAGAVLELGILDLYQGRFADALVRSRDLYGERGRYAIARWPAWGYWLAGYAHAYRGEVDASRESLATARAYFESEPLPRAVADCAIGEMFCARVAVAVGRAEPVTAPPGEWASMSPRQKDDVRLVLADHLIAAGDREGAQGHLETVLAAPSTPAARWWAELGMAELRRLAGHPRPGFGPVRDHAATVGARWLEAQAREGLSRAGGDPDAESVTAASTVDPPQLGSPRSPPYHGLGDPPVLWLVT